MRPARPCPSCPPSARCATGPLFVPLSNSPCARRAADPAQPNPPHPGLERPTGRRFLQLTLIPWCVTIQSCSVPRSDRGDYSRHHTYPGVIYLAYTLNFTHAEYRSSGNDGERSSQSCSGESGNISPKRNKRSGRRRRRGRRSSRAMLVECAVSVGSDMATPSPVVTNLQWLVPDVCGFGADSTLRGMEVHWIGSRR